MARAFLQNVSESIDSHAERINEAAVDFLPQITERLQRIGTQLEQTTATVHGMSEAAIDREALTHNLEAFTAGVRSLLDGTSVAVADVLKALVKAVDGIASAALQYALELLQVSNRGKREGEGEKEGGFTRGREGTSMCVCVCVCVVHPGDYE